MRRFSSIFIAKLVLLIGKIIKRGSSLPGEIAYKLNKKIFSDLERPKLVIVVTGSSGKGSTTSLITKVLRKENYKVAYNDKGSNQRPAIITTLIDNAKLNGKTKVDAAVFEIDERSCKYILPFIKPDYVVITNITRDQPPRQRHYDFIFNEIEKSLEPNCNLVLNGDDPYLQKFTLLDKYNIKYFGIKKTKYSYQENKFTSLNITRCPRCNKTLTYKYYHIEHLGDYNCKLCNFTRPKINYDLTKYDDKTKTLIVNKKYKIYIENDMLFNFYNTLAAFSILDLVGIDKKKSQEYISNINKDKKIFNYYKKNNKNIYVLNNKAENATTYNQSILYTTRSNKPKTIVLGWKEISRRYEFDDLSWLYDVEFELLNNNLTKKIILTGPQRFDIAVRLKYAGFDEKKITCYENLYIAKNDIVNTKTDIYAILNFDYLETFNDIMEVE